MSGDDKISQSVDSRTAGLNRSGRPKGAINKTTATAKNAIAMAAEELGGAERLVEWAKSDPKNERDFWVVVYPKLLPLQVQAEVEAEVVVNGVLTWQSPQ